MSATTRSTDVDRVVGVDVGGTTTSAVLVDATGTVTARDTAPTPARGGPSAVLDLVAALVRSVDPGRLAPLVGVGATGVVDPLDGTVIAATSAMPGWEGTDIPTALTALVDGRHVSALNDVHAFTLAEAALGAGAGAAGVLGVTVGTGVGGALVTDGRLALGRRGAAGHVGHVPVPAAVGLLCPCGARGHVEAVSSGPAMLDAYRERAAGPVVAVDLAEVARRARDGDEVAVEVLAHGGHHLGLALAGVAAVCAPDVIVLGGGVLGAGELVLGPLRDALAEFALPVVADVPVRKGLLGADAVAVGGALYAAGRTDVHAARTVDPAATRLPSGVGR